MNLTTNQLKQIIKEELVFLENLASKRTKLFLTKVLRHSPELLGLNMEPSGWVNVDELISAFKENGKILDRNILDNIVKLDNKQRFAYDETGTKIRANQGHSISVELNLPIVKPPEKLYHGTVSKFIPLIKKSGLKKMSRHDVHLSSDIKTAMNVGGRRGKPVILTIDSGRMHRDGYMFKLSKNNVWLIDFVPSTYINYGEEV